ncbi:MAG: STAS domain-containing protein [Candidatus Sumerlaeaceae bacterium]
MLIRSQQIGEELQLFVGSPLTADNCAAARTAIQKHSTRSNAPVVVVDLEKCAYMDTPGLSLLFELRKTSQELGRTAILQNPSRAVQRILNITQMHRVFQIRQTSVDLERIPSAKPVVNAADMDTVILPKP